MTELDEDIHQVLATTFGIDPAGISPEASRETIDRWDSLGQIGLVLELERHFGISIDVQHIAGLTSFVAVREILIPLVNPAT